MTDPREISQEKIQKPTGGLFSKRTATDDVKVGTVTFVIRALSATLYSALVDGNKNLFGTVLDGGFTMDIFRYGVTDIKNLTDETNTEVKAVFQENHIAGQKYRLLKRSIVDGLPVELIQLIAKKIIDLSKWSKEDADRLGFTGESSDESSASENTSDTPTEPPS